MRAEPVAATLTAAFLADPLMGWVFEDPAARPAQLAHWWAWMLDHLPGHAEVLAIRAAAERLGEWRLSGCTLVVTLEPCTMCAGAAVLARVERLVFGAYDEKAGAVGSLWDVVRDRRLNHRPEVVGGVLAEESTTLLDTFFAQHR